MQNYKKKMKQRKPKGDGNGKINKLQHCVGMICIGVILSELSDGGCCDRNPIFYAL